MKPELIIHIGAGKVASSTIQRYLQDTAAQYYDDGVIVADNNFERIPPEGAPVPGPSNFLIDHFNEGRSLLPLMHGIHKLADAAESRGISRLVWSAENLYTINSDQRPTTLGIFAELQKRFDIRALYYIRRQDYWLESAWKQWIMKVDKKPAGDAIATLASAGHPDFLSVARDWSELLGKDNFYVNVLYPEVLVNGDIIDDLCQHAGLPRYSWENSYQANPIFNVDLLEFMHRARRVLFKEANDNRVFKALYRYGLGVDTERSQRLLSEDERRFVVSRFREQNARLIEEFMPDRAEKLEVYFDLDSEEVDLSRPKGRITEKKVALAAGIAVATAMQKALIEDIEAHRDELESRGRYAPLMAEWHAIEPKLKRHYLEPFLWYGRLIRRQAKITRELMQLKLMVLFAAMGNYFSDEMLLTLF